MNTPLSSTIPASAIRAVLAALDAEHRLWRTEGTDADRMETFSDVRDWLSHEACQAETKERCY